MSTIAKIDNNFKVETTIERDGLRFYDVETAPFRIYGVFKENGLFRRMPEAVAKTVNDGVASLHKQAAGGRVRFVTNSPYVAIKTKYIPEKMSHFALTGSCGFDLYTDIEGESRYVGTYCPPFDVIDGYDGVIDFPDSEERVVTINFPLYSAVEKLYIGVCESADIKPAPEYKITKPVVFYGSSITQGGCASKPGSTYQSILSRKFDFDFVNLGFSGNARGEDEITEYISKLDMSVFVMDYDFNAPSIEHLRNTHERMFLAIRKEQPELPIIILNRPKYYLNQMEKEKLAIITATYENAKKNGDRNVFLVTGNQMLDLVKDDGTVDGIHPSDSGFFNMARAVGKVFAEILG